MTDRRLTPPLAIGFGAAQTALALLGVTFQPTSVPLSAWWPAAGLAVVLLVFTRRRDWPLVMALVMFGTTVGNLLSGSRTLESALLFGLGNALEGPITAGLLTWRRSWTLRSVRDLWRLLGCAFVGAAVSGVVPAGTLAVLSSTRFWDAWGVYVFSHPAGVLLVAPVALLAPAVVRPRPVELLVQTSALVAGTLLVFRFSLPTPLSFVPMALMTWAAARFGPRVTAWQLLLVAAVVSISTVAGLGPFGHPLEPTWWGVRAAQLYLLVMAIMMSTLALAVADRDRSNQQLAASEYLFRRTFDEAMLGMVILRLRDGVWVLVRVNPEAKRLLECGPVETDRPVRSVIPEIDDVVRQVATGEQGLRHEAMLRSGHRVSMTLVPSLDPATSAVERISVQMVDVTEEHRVRQRLQVMAMSDPLTGLANRSLLQTQLNQLLLGRSAMPVPGTVLLLYLDLDDFKNVNDSSGHVVGDEVLLQVSARLAAAVPQGCTVARLGGDEFVVLVPDVPEPAQDYAYRLADELIDAVSRPVQVRDRWYRVGASVGMTLSRPGSTTESMLREADSAMFQAKRDGKNRNALFAQELQDAALRRITLDAELHAAFDRGEFELHIQPVIELATGRITGGEALVRWRHPTRGLLLPDEWLDIVADSSMMERLGSWVIAEACRQARAWPVLTDGTPMTVHANVSGHQLGRNRLVGQVLDALRASGLPPRRLVLELTETELVREIDLVTPEIVSLRQHGVRLAADDVGTGYSSLRRLTDMPIDIIKVDRTFVSRMRHDERARAVVEGLVTLGSAMHLEVVAEGVEDPACADRLRELGCGSAQGFLWSHPVPGPDFLRLATGQGVQVE